jgi:hypothetical protein
MAMRDKRVRSRGFSRLIGGLFALLSLSFFLPPVFAQQVHRNRFEALKTFWVKSGADAAYDELSHLMSDQGAHDGQRSEYLRLETKPGSFIHYQYSTGRAPISSELSAAVWIKANRPGIQLLARVVLPNERAPNNLQERLTTYLRGDLYRTAGRWQRLEIGRPVQLAKEQQQLLQAQFKRQLNFSDAFLDALVLNVHAGPGPTEVWIDDLEVGPVLPEQSPFQPTSRPSDAVVRPPPVPQATPLPPRAGTRTQVVEFNGTQLLVGGKRYFFRGIRHTDTPLRVLRDAGFNTVFLDHSASPTLIQEAIELGFWLVPSMRPLSEGNRLASSEEIGREMSRYVQNDAVLFWHLGGTLGYEQAATIGKLAQHVRAADPGRPLGAEAWDGLQPYSRILNVVGIYRWPLMTTLELPKYRDWLDQRRQLANPGSFVWTWIQTHLPDWHSHLLYDRSGAAAFDEPVGPQAEQVRLMAYTAIGAGCKGIAFWSDRFLADSHQGRDRLLGTALLNQELEMLEPVLVMVDTDPQWIDTSVPEVKAAVLRTSKGILVLPMWIGKGAQFVPGQAAASKLSLVVPQVPQSHQAWEVTPGEVRGLRVERVVGGTKVTLPEFGLTTALVFTSDTNLIIRFQEQSRSMRQLAAQWTYDLALYEIEKVLKTQEQLERLGHTLPDAPQLVKDAQDRLRTAKGQWDDRAFAGAYREGQRALRPVRILMRAQWDKAVKGLDTPVASPYAVSFFTLPRHWQLMEQIGRSVPTANVLPGGDFEIIPQRVQESWKVDEPTLDEVELLAQRVSEIPQPLSVKPGAVPTTVDLPKKGKQCLMLQIKPKQRAAGPLALERTLLAINSPPVQLPPGTLVQVSGWVRVPAPITASADGALFYDSAGGEPLAVRLTEPTPWKRFTLYRRVPSSGTLQVTLALTGIGTVYFDDIRIEPLVPSAGNATAAQFAPAP